MIWVAFVIAWLSLVETRVAFAGCNIIPPAIRTFRGDLGVVDRPFARPGDWLTISASDACSVSAPALPDTADAVVTLIFTPPGGVPGRVVAFTEQCGALDLAGCAAPVACITANSASDPVSLERLDERTLRFRFPDTDASFQGTDDDRTLAGSARIAVTSVAEPLPCALLTTPCAQHEGARACVDALYANNGTCNQDPDATFSHFTALPPPNNYAALCTEPAFPAGPCTGSADEVRFTIDAAGNVLLPMDWRGVRVDRDAVPIARLLRASSNVEAFPGGGVPVNVTDLASLGSYSPEGIKLPPLFDPQQNPADQDVATFFGSTDAAETVLRIARGSACGGAASGASCADDGDCPDGDCDPGLFDFSSRLLEGVGPAVLRLGACFGGTSPLATCVDDASCAGGQCGDFRFVALDPVPLDGLNQSEALNAFVLEEPIPNPPQDFNGDGDADDHVIKLGDRASGLTQAIGINGSEGRAIARVLQAPFSFPALAAEGDVVAFLEPEPLQAGIDTNGNGLIFDSTLRVYRIGPTGAVDLSPNPSVAAEAEPVIDGRSVAVSGGRIFFRRAEREGAPSVVTEEFYVTPPGIPIDGVFGGSSGAILSDDARYVMFGSDSAQLVPGDDNNVCDHNFDGVAAENCNDVFVLDRRDHSTTRVSVASDGTEGNADSFLGPMSPSGRFITFSSDATNLDPAHPGAREFIHDRATRSTTGVPLDGIQGISDDGQLALSLECEPTGPSMQRCDERLLDRRTGIIARVGAVLGSMSTTTVDFPVAGALSPDGNLVTYWSNFDDPVAGTGEGRGGIFVHDRTAGTTTRVSVSIDGVPANAPAYFSALSRDGRFVAFDSPATNLVPGDTNGVFDLFVHDRLTGFTGRVNVSSTGEQAGGDRSIYPLFSGARFGLGNRRVYFLSPALNLTEPDPNGSFYYVHDRLTGQTAAVPFSRPDLPGASYARTSLIGISADERVRAFQLCEPIPGQENCRPGFRFEEIDPARGDLTGDGDVSDTVLSVLDATSGSVIAICPADAVSIANGSAAFLRPETAGMTPALTSCPVSNDDGADLNGDGDADDDVVHLWSVTGSARNLGRAATAVSLSERALAALVSESDQGATDLNGDADASDTVAQVFADDQWINLGQAADFIQANEAMVAFRTAEAGQGDSDLNEDGDAADRVVQVFAVDEGRLANIGQAVEDLIVGPTGLVAFRTREASQGNQPLNSDGDSDDDVLQVYDPSTGRVLNTGLAVTPCMLEACDPRAPYRVLNDTVKFLTYESAQGADLNGDGDATDLVVQVVNVRQACHTGSMAGACHALAAVTAGICTTTAEACAADATCGGGTCFVPPGGCIRDLGTPCTLREAQACGPDAFCQPRLGTPGAGTCHAVEGTCRDNADCTAPATCSDGGKTFNRLLDPLKQQNGGAVVFTGAGRCVEDFGVACQTSEACGAGGFCDQGVCQREHGVCARDADCPTGSSCRQDLVRATADDADGDELPDPFDNCPQVSNIMQEDADSDGVGDACEGTASAPSDDDGCAVVAPRPTGAVGLAIWLLPMLVVVGLRLAHGFGVRRVSGALSASAAKGDGKAKKYLTV